MADITKIRIGVCDVTYKGVACGHTKGGVEVKYDPNYAELNVDQYGKTTVDLALVEEKFTVKFELAEITPANWAVSIPNGALTSGTGGTGKLVGGSNAGGLQSALAGALVLHPIKNGAGDNGEDITVFKAISTEAVSVKYAADSQRTLDVTMTALIDESQPVGSRLFRVGPANVS